MSYPALAIANEFLKIATESNQTLSPMKLQKLVYFAHGWYLALREKSLINEPIEAWKFGPVIPSIYHSAKVYGNRAILPTVLSEPSSPNSRPLIDNGPDKNENEDVKQLVKRIWEVYGGFSAFQLSNMTHKKDSPWYQADKAGEYFIDTRAIAEYFKQQIKRTNA